MDDTVRLRGATNGGEGQTSTPYVVSHHRQSDDQEVDHERTIVFHGRRIHVRHSMMSNKATKIECVTGGVRCHSDHESQSTQYPLLKSSRRVDPNLRPAAPNKGAGDAGGPPDGGLIQFEADGNG